MATKCHGHGHSHDFKSSKHVFYLAIGILFGFALIELITGKIANSLALISDAGHMATDGLSLIVAAVANWIAVKPPSKKHSYGLGRAEVLGAWISSLLMVIIALVIGVEAIQRIKSPPPVSSHIVIIIGSFGIITNFILLWLLNHTERTLNARAALLHILGDLFGSFAALAAGLVIYFSGWLPIDPILSIFIALLILLTSFRLLKETLLVLMEGVPLHLDIKQVEMDMCQVENVNSVHDLHIWTLSTGKIVLSAHIELKDLSQWEITLGQLSNLLAENFQITHITLQPETKLQMLHPVHTQC